MNTTHSSWKAEFYHLVFWGYNIVFSFLFLFILGQGLASGQEPILTEVLRFWGSFPPHVLAMICTALFTPFLSMILATSSKMQKHTGNLMKLFFGFEIPLIGLSLIGIIFLRQLTLVTTLLYVSIFLSIVGLLLYLFNQHIQSKIKVAVLMFSQQIALVVASYVFLLGFFFLPIVIAYFIKIVGRINAYNFIDEIVWSIQRDGLTLFLVYSVFGLFFRTTMVFFAFAPIGAFITFFKICAILYQKVQKSYGLKKARILRYGTSAVFIILLPLLFIQSNAQKYNSLISNYKNAQTFEEKQVAAKMIIPKQNEIKNNLISSYLAQYRYFSDSSMNVLIQGYTNELGMNEKSARSIQKLFNTLAAPFIYKGTFEDDIKHATEYYQEVFDNSIQKGELKTISKTLRATNTRDTLKAGILDLDKQTVRIVSKAVTVNELYDGLFATVTVEEEYINTANEMQEVYYEFSLPDNAVLTELKLGPDLQIGANSADKPRPTPQGTTAPQPSTAPSPSISPGRVDNAVVAPKGAANTVYENQIFRRTDPALLIQVGPRQYKLRVYPIPVKGQTIEGQIPVDGVEPKNQKVRYSYVTMRTVEGIPLPSITEQRNVFADKNTKLVYSLNGQPVDPGISSFIKTSVALPCPSDTLQTQTPAGTVMFIPYSRNPFYPDLRDCTKDISTIKRVLGGNHFALMIDVSYSNSKKDWSKYLRENFPIKEMMTGNNTVEVYFFNDTVSEPIYLTEDILQSGLTVTHIGKTDRIKALASLTNSYNAIMMVTDDSVFDAKPEIKNLSVKAPIYIIHPEGKIPPYNDVLTNAVIQSNGRVIANGHEAYNHFWQETIFPYVSNVGTKIDTNEYGTWVLLSEPHQISGINLDSNSPFAKLAQKRLIIDSMRQAGQSVSNVMFLDRINQISEQSNIVTPYSSMIVLVTEDQKRQLETAKKQSNRYELSLDTGEETLDDPSGRGILEVGAVPEPHEWLLIFTACLLLTYLYRAKLRELAKRYL